MDWVGLLTDHDIPYVTRGPNTKRGEVSVKCPWCGEDDPSEHLGISLTTENWGCYRSATHRGKAAPRLIAGLLGCTHGHAKALAKAYSAPDPSSLDHALAMLTRISVAPEPATGLEVITYLPEFRPIKATGTGARFWRYLASRHFDDVAALVARYDLQACETGRWKDRVIVPVYQGGGLIGWTARAIQRTISAPRYLSSSDAIKKVVFNEDELQQGGDLLFVVEGPFDALKLDYYGEPYGVRATCAFGVSMSLDQVCTLMGLRRLFKRVVILLDRAAIEPAFDALDWLQAPNVSIGSLPEGFKDPGEMKREDVEALIEEHL